MLDINHKDIGGYQCAYQVFGTGKISLVVEMGLGAVMGEWWHIAQRLSQGDTVLLYERNRDTKTERTPQNIAKELYALLTQLNCAEKIVMIGHSQGGLYAQQFARLYPQMVKGVVLLDPLSANDSRYKELLTPAEQKKSGFDKTANLVIMKRLAQLHLGFAIKAVMKKAPPFYYYHDFSKDAAEYILSSMTKPTLYASALEEYRLAHDEKEIAGLKVKSGFPDIPLVLITHTSEFSVREIVEFGQTSAAFAEKVESIWQSLMKEYLSFSGTARLMQAQNSGHFLHLTEPELISGALRWIKEAQ